jgi:hypothetical protein
MLLKMCILAAGKFSWRLIWKVTLKNSLMELSPSWEPVIMQLLKNFQAFYGTRRFITEFTRALQLSLSWAFRLGRLSKQSVQARGFLRIFVTSIFFYGEELLAPVPAPKLEDHPLSAVRNCL